LATEKQAAGYNFFEFGKEDDMADLTPPVVDCEQANAGLDVEDIATAVEFYTKRLGFALGFTWGDPPTFAGVTLGKAQMFLRKGTPEPKGSQVYFHVGDADELHAFHCVQGVEVVEPIGDREYGIRDYSVRDLHGYYLTFGHPLYNLGPAIKIERVDVPVRLEKRLAALLADLAAHKRLSVNSCLEEMLLHTNEGVEPHTAATLRHIKELKEKHGIDYDSHGSYRFVEG
jgi:catechol 2,3-dioxygenase-like lactoylglutathione lyase family enzyme